MAEPTTNSKAMTAEEKQKLLAEARKRYDRAMERERDNITAAYEDLEFMAGEHWTSEELTDRKGRPSFRINQLPQFVHQVTGDIRQMKPGIKVVPVDDQADPKLADLRAGMIRYIENRSDAAGVYFQAADGQVACGISHWRVMSEYADDSTFEQELRIAAVDDGVSVLWDPDAKLLTREDAKFCFVPIDYTKDAFEATWPNASKAEMEDVKTWNNYSEWVRDDVIRVAEYWVKKPIKIKLALTHDGRTINLDEEPEAEQILIAEAVSRGAPAPRIEERDTYKVCRYLITAMDVLEGPDELPVRYIPIIPVVGEEVRIGRKVIRKGIVRDAKDPQRLYNYFRSAQAEVVAMQPKAPFMVTELNVAKYQDLWEKANSANLPFLVFTPDPANGGAQPQRMQPAMSSQGIDEGVALANEDLRRVIGIYDASLGAKSNETSGKAIMARQREGDTGTYLYIDNFNRAVRHTAKIVNDWLPHVYDTQRTIRIMGEDGKVDLMLINQEVDEAGQPIIDEQGQPIILHDLSSGSYDIVFEMGPSYSTKREEAREGMTALLQAAPEAMPMVMDAYVMSQDWPEKEKIARRFRLSLPPQIAKAEALAEQGVPEEQIQQAMMQDGGQPSPEQQAAQAEMEAKAQQSQIATQTAGMKMAEQEAATRKAQADAQAAEEQLAIQERVALEKVHAEISIMWAKANAQIEIDKMKAGAQVATEHAKTEAAIDHQHDQHNFDMATAAESHSVDMAHSQENHEISAEAARKKAQAAARPRG